MNYNNIHSDVKLSMSEIFNAPSMNSFKIDYINIGLVKEEEEGLFTITTAIT